MKNFDWEAFFDDWKKEFNIDVFAKDGIICPEKYENVLFILKDVNNAKPGEDIDLRKSLTTRTDEGKTWFDITAWTAALLDGVILTDVTHELQHKYLGRAAVINLKKEAGGPRADSKEISCCSSEQRKYILKEIKECNPRLIIACSREVFDSLTDNVFKIDDKDNKVGLIRCNEKMSSYGRFYDIGDYLDSKDPVYLVEYRHPNQCGRNGTREEHCENMLRIRMCCLNEIR